MHIIAFDYKVAEVLVVEMLIKTTLASALTNEKEKKHQATLVANYLLRSPLIEMYADDCNPFHRSTHGWPLFFVKIYLIIATL
jgi:hypothetical protein